MQTVAASAQAFELGVALLAPNEHPWEIQFCAALAATLKGDDSRIILRKDRSEKEIRIKDEPGVGIDWSSEPGFAQIRWQTPQK